MTSDEIEAFITQAKADITRAQADAAEAKEDAAMQALKTKALEAELESLRLGAPTAATFKEKSTNDMIEVVSKLAEQMETDRKDRAVRSTKVPDTISRKADPPDTFDGVRGEAFCESVL